MIAIDGFGGDSGNYVLRWTMESTLVVSIFSDGVIRLTLEGVDSQRYTLLSSSDLLNWSTNSRTITMQGDSHDLTIEPRTNFLQSHQFFRALLIP